MESRTPTQSVLKDDRWASGVLLGKESKIKLHLTTFPGLVGGTFRSVVMGLTPDYFGEANVTVTCSVLDSSTSADGSNHNSAGIDFQEVELLLVDDLKFDILFHIPFEAHATEEGGVWQLIMQFVNGATEIFDIPMCRTRESNSEITAAHIASQRFDQKKQQQSEVKNASNEIQAEPYTLEIAGGKLTLQSSPSPAGRPTFAKGLAIFTGLWVVMTVFFYWLLDGPLNLVLVFGGFTVFMLICLIFLLYGTSHCIIDREQMVSKHKLFGCTLNSRKTDRGKLTGFSPKLLTTAPSNKKFPFQYWVIGLTENNDSRIFSFTIFGQNEARVLAKKLSDFLRQE